jgi:hypothetical protein
MKNTSLLFFLMVLSLPLFAQDQVALEYIQQFNQEFVYMQKIQIDYSALLVHRREEIAARKRLELENLVGGSLAKFQDLKPHPKDKGLRSSVITSLELMQKLINKDYEEAIQKKVKCTDCFESLLAEYELSQADSRAIEKQLAKVQQEIARFAKDNNIKLRYAENEYNQVLAKINQVNDYAQELDLVLLQINYAENALIKALNKGDIPTAKKELKQFNLAFQAAQTRFKKIKRFKEDQKAYASIERYLAFYEQAYTKYYPEMLSAFDDKGQVINTKVETYNKNIEILSQGPKLMQAFYEAKEEMLRTHVPQPKPVGP